MHKYSFMVLSGLLVILLLPGCGSVNNIPDGDSVISEQRIHDYLFHLASDSLKGRNTPSIELDSAAAYIASEFHALGIKPVNGSYFQKVPLGKVNLGEENYLKITKGDKTTSYLIKKEFIPFDITANNQVAAEIVFAGYGINAPEYNYNDYSRIDVKNKIVFILRHEPQENDSTSVFNGTKISKYSELKRKVKTAFENGALAVLISQDPLNHSMLTPQGYPWPSLSKLIPKDALPLSLLLDEKEKLPVVQVGKEVIEQLFGSVDNLKQVQAAIDNEMKPNTFLIEGVSVDIKTSTVITDQSASNVIGMIEGADPELKNEFVIIGAHYDHDGYLPEHVEGQDYIFNGADDNASGTTAVMAAAAAFALSKEKPKRSVLFMAFAGEEKGLFGSRYYAENPLLPLEKTVAMLNMDMVGRNHPDSLYVFGADVNPSLNEITLQQNNDVGLNIINEPEGIMGGSDHQSFLKKGVPALHFFSGMHEDYHKVTDSADKIDLTKLNRVSKLAFRTARYIANNKIYFKLIKEYKSIL